MPPAALTEHCAVLGLALADARDAAAVERAYRQRALQAHPDRPSGDAAVFKRVAAAKEALLQRIGSAGGPSSAPKPRSGDGSTATHATRARASTTAHVDPFSTRAGPAPTASRTSARRPSSGPSTAAAGVPPPFRRDADIRRPFAAILKRSGALYTFDAAPEAFGSSGLRHGDPVRRYTTADGPEGATGVIVGVASTGTVYWWERGCTGGAATVFGALSGPKAVRFNKLRMPGSQPSGPAPAAPPARAAEAPVRQQQQSEQQERQKPVPTSHREAERKSQPPPQGEADREHHQQQLVRQRLSALVRDEEAARSAFAARVTAFYAQASWVHQLPRYAALDRKYNAAFL